MLHFNPMQSGQTQDIYAQFRDQEIQVTPFASARMGLLAGQTVLRIDTYNIICMPFRLSMSGAKLLASFSREEMVFFQRYLKGLAGLTLMMQPANSPQALKIFARCLLKGINPMSGREAVGLIEVDWKPCPPDLVTMTGDYLMLLDRLKQEYEEFKTNLIQINGENSKLLGYNNFAELFHEKQKVRVAIFLLGTSRLDFLIPVSGPSLAKNQAIQIKLFFQSFQFMVRGNVSEHLVLPNGAQKIRADIEFSAELVDIIEHYRFTERFATKQSNDAAQ